MQLSNITNFHLLTLILESWCISENHAESSMPASLVQKIRANTIVGSEILHLLMSIWSSKKYKPHTQVTPRHSSREAPQGNSTSCPGKDVENTCHTTMVSARTHTQKPTNQQRYHPFSNITYLVTESTPTLLINTSNFQTSKQAAKTETKWRKKKRTSKKLRITKANRLIVQIQSKQIKRKYIFDACSNLESSRTSSGIPIPSSA